MTLATVEHVYAPRGTAAAIMTDRSPEILVSGPAGTGKSRACLEKLAFCAKKYAGMRGLIMRQTLASLGSTALATWRQWVIDQDLATGEVSFYGGSREEPAQYRFGNGSSIHIGGMDKPSKIMSSEYDLIYVQEATELKKEGWEAANSRLRNGVMPYQQLLADCNPDSQYHWLYTRCTIDGTCRMYNSLHEENPVYFDEVVDPFTGEAHYVPTERGKAYIARLDALTGVRHLRLRKGLWVAAEGVIYDKYDPARIVIDPFPIPDEWQRFWAVDFGYVHPFVLQCWAEDPSGTLYLYREIYMSGRTVDEHCTQIMEYVSEPIEGYVHPENKKRFAFHGRKWTERRPRAIVCDHDAEGRATLARELNMATTAADKDVEIGIERVQVRFRDATIKIFRDARVEKDTRLELQERPTCTIEEIPGYVWDTSSGKIEGMKDAPLKDRDDGCDTMRYLVAYRDPSKQPGIRSM